MSTTSKARTILIVAAHPDDEVLGCGGSIPRWVDDGARVYVQILGEGITSRLGFEDDVQQLSVHHERARKAGALLGVTEMFLEKLPDQRFDAVPLLDITRRIEALIERLCPDCVYTQHGGDLNLDHAVTFRATMTATRPMRGSIVRAVCAYPVASSTEWAFGQFEPRFTPNVFSDISGTLERKIAAMQIYESETRPAPHPRSPESLRAAAALWGSHCGLDAAEPFQIIWELA